MEEKTGLTMNVNDPKAVMIFAKELKKFIKESKLSCIIQGSEYVNVDGWKYAGINFGLLPQVSEPVQESIGDIQYVFCAERTKAGSVSIVPVLVVIQKIGEIMLKNEEWKEKYKKYYIIPVYKYTCKCSLVKADGSNVGGTAVMVCSNTELNKVTFEEYAIQSMAQTRAIGKAYKNVIGFLMKAAGYETTPSEEMEGVKTENANIINDYEEIQRNVELITDLPGLEKYWAQNSDMHKDKKFKDIINKHKNKISKQK